MTTTTISSIPNVLATLSGSEVIELELGATSYQSTTGAIAAIAGAAVGPSATLVSKLRAALAQSATANPATAQPLIAPAAWPAATAVTKGFSCTNGAGTYYVLTSGTTAASGGPTGSGSAPIIDGTAVWYYAGPSFSSNDNAPSFSVVSSASRYSSGVFWTNAAGTRSDGASAIRDSGNFQLTSSAFSETGPQGSIVSSTQSTTADFSFVTDAPAFQIVTGGGSAPNGSIYVDGVPLTLGYGSQSWPGGSVVYWQLVFSSRTPRRITFEQQGGLDFYGVLTQDTTSQVWAPQVQNLVRFAVVGTSYISGSGTHPVVAGLGIGPLVGKLFGSYDCWCDGLGAGSGYIANGSNGPYSTPTRFNAMTAYAPEVLIVTGGGVNDRQTGATLATEQAAVLAYLQQVRAASADVTILVVGSEAGATGPAANVFTMELAANQAVAQFADPNCFFIPQSSTVAERAWIYGTGITTAPNGSGNSDNYIGNGGDTTHPVQLGVYDLAKRHLHGIIGVVNSL